MTELSGTIKQKALDHGLVPLEHTEAHLQDTINSERCYFCHKEKNNDMVLLRTGDKTLSITCLDHPGIMQEFLRQFKRPPLGWQQTIAGGSHGHRPGSRGDNNG